MKCAHCGRTAETMTKRSGEYLCADPTETTIPCWAMVTLYSHATPCTPCTRRRQVIEVRNRLDLIDEIIDRHIKP